MNPDRSHYPYAAPERHAGPERLRERRSPVLARPDRIALWAVFMAVIAMVAAAASSQASSGGIGDPSEAETQCAAAEFGKRNLSLGDCGHDVKTLNWLLRSQAGAAPLGKRFAGGTERTVVKLQRRGGIDADGVVDRRTRKQIVRSMSRDVATWYGPGFYGNQTACGQRLGKRTVGVAHKRLPCGTKVTVAYKGRFLRTRVIDRGPYAHGAKWDLTGAAAQKLGFTVTDKVRVAAIR